MIKFIKINQKLLKSTEHLQELLKFVKKNSIKIIDLKIGLRKYSGHIIDLAILLGK